jgi:hypothetical protein
LQRINVLFERFDSFKKREKEAYGFEASVLIYTKNCTAFRLVFLTNIRQNLTLLSQYFTDKTAAEQPNSKH